MRLKLEEWRSLITRHVQDGRQALREILEGPIQFWPIKGQRAFRFKGKADMEPMFAGVAGLPPFLASPRGARVTFDPKHEEAYELALSGTVRRAA